MLSLPASFLSSSSVEVVSDPNIGSVFIITDLESDVQGVPPVLFAVGREVFIDIVASLQEKALLEEDHKAQLLYSERLRGDLEQAYKEVASKKRLLRLAPWLVGSAALLGVLVGFGIGR